MIQCSHIQISGVHVSSCLLNLISNISNTDNNDINQIRSEKYFGPNFGPKGYLKRTLKLGFVVKKLALQIDLSLHGLIHGICHLNPKLIILFPTGNVEVLN